MGADDGMMAGPVSELLNSQQFSDVNGPPVMGPLGSTGVPAQSIFSPSISPTTEVY